MKKLLLSTALLSALVLTGCAPTVEDVAEETVATYADGEVTHAEFYDKMKSTYGEATLQQMLIEEVLAGKYGENVTDESVQAAYDSEQEFYGGADNFAQVLETSGYTEDSYKDIIRYSLLMEETVKANTEFTEEETKAAYDAYVAPTTAAHILVTDEALAKDLIAQLNDGADFATLAKENSVDTGTAELGGEVTFTKGEMVPEFEEGAMALENGAITKEPVASEFGFHIIKMVEKGEKGTLDEEKETIKTNLMISKLSDNEYVSGIVTKVLQDAGIKITDEDLKSAMDMYLKTEEEPVEEESVEESTESVETTEESTDEATKESEEKTDESVESEESSKE